MLAAARSMRGLKARTNFMYPTHETCLLSAAAALAAPNGGHHASQQYHQVELIAQKTLGEVLLLLSSNNKKPATSCDWRTTQLLNDDAAATSRDVFGNGAGNMHPKQMGDFGSRLPGDGCRYVERRIVAERTPDILQHHDVKPPPVESGLFNKVEVEAFRVSPGRQEEWHSSEPDPQFRLSQFESRSSSIVNPELFVSRYCAGTGSQPFQVSLPTHARIHIPLTSFTCCMPSEHIMDIKQQSLHCRSLELRTA